MIDVEGFDDLLAELDQFGTELQEVTTTSLQDLASTIPNELKRMIFSEKQDRTGTLKNSIQATVRGNNLELSMVYYGYYQVFGVTGAQRGSLQLPDSVLGAFGTVSGGDRFKFTKTNHPGIFGVPQAANLIGSLDELIIEAITE